MKWNPEYQLCEVLGIEYLVPVRTKTFQYEDAIAFNEMGAEILHIIIEESQISKDEVVEAVCRNYEAETQEEKALIAEAVELFLTKALHAGYVLQ